MSREINVNRLRLLLSKSLFYIFIPLSLVAMDPTNPPGPDPYVQMYDRYTANYNNIDQGANLLLDNYNNELLNSFQSMYDGALQAYLWAQHHNRFAQIDSNKSRLISDRIISISGRITTFAANAQAREQAGQPIAGDQNILNALNQSNNIIQQSQNAVNQSGRAANRSQTAMRNAKDRRNQILQIINQMNPQILNIGYTVADIQIYNQYLTNITTNFRQANRFAREAIDYAIAAHIEVARLDQLMQDIRQEGNNIGIALP